MPFLCRNGRCRNTIGGFVCECADGYVLAQDGQHCRDIDECHEVCRVNPDEKFSKKITNRFNTRVLTIIIQIGYRLINNHNMYVNIKLIY